MRRIMTASVLNDYLSSTHATLMLCRAHGDLFDLSPEEAKDAAYRIMLSMVQLEELRDEILYGPLTDNTVVPFPGRLPAVPSVCVQPAG